ncbi:MAG TPA: metallophosphoesterase family protein [Casimicrobiaceae bacterium]|nr:metallophosphoesterase family protein [Casimicrobiaceae bacterium]
MSDIHANLEAFTACLAHARERRADAYALLGDFVGYGADAVAVVDAVVRLTAEGGIALKGNHDAAMEHLDSYFNDDARAALDWASRTLADGHKRFLAALPLTVERSHATYVHASAATPARWDYVDSPSAALRCAQAAGTIYTFCGHVHDQQLYFATSRGRMSAFTPTPGTPVPIRGPRQWLAIVGSVGQPRDRNPAAAYAIFDDAKREITFFRVPYDHHAAAAKIREAGLPEALAYRVEAGI